MVASGDGQASLGDDGKGVLAAAARQGVPIVAFVQYSWAQLLRSLQQVSVGMHGSPVGGHGQAAARSCQSLQRG